MKEQEMQTVSNLIAEVLRKVDDENIAQQVKAQAADLCANFTPYPPDA
jgi:glycine/serine hydroxymethyltransferase